MQITFIDGLSNTNFIKSPFKKSPVFMQTSVVHQIHNAEHRLTKLQSWLSFSSSGFFGASSALAFSRASYFFLLSARSNCCIFLQRHQPWLCTVREVRAQSSAAQFPLVPLALLQCQSPTLSSHEAGGSSVLSKAVVGLSLELLLPK